jgi:DNA-binding SARP family transcriptional activator
VSWAEHRPGGANVQLHLLGEFTLATQDDVVDAGSGAQRLLAYLAVRAAPVRRAQAAEALWLLSSGSRALSNLRAVLCRLPRPHDRPLVETTGSYVRLAPDVSVDLALAQQQIEAARWAGPGPAQGGDSPDLLTRDLLPTWDDDWLTIERERHRQLRLHALENLAARLCRQSRFDEALSAALAAVSGEPLRESAQRRLIEVHLAEGNVAEALRQYELFRRLLRDELGLPPSNAIRRLVASWLGRPIDGAEPDGEPSGPTPGPGAGDDPLPHLH